MFNRKEKFLARWRRKIPIRMGNAARIGFSTSLEQAEMTLLQQTDLKKIDMRNGYCVYILLCADGTYYTGMTNNIERRFAEHETGYNEDAYTFSRRPVELMWAEKYSRPRTAYAIERKIKKWSVAKKKALIEERFEDLKNYARCLNKTSHVYWKERLKKEMESLVCSSKVENNSRGNV